MKRSLELARTILLAIERSEDDEPSSIRLPTADYDELHISLHVRLLKEADLIHAIESTRGFNASSSWIPHSLTWKGHDFLDAVRNESVWRAIKSREADFGSDLPADVIYDLAIRDVRKRVGL